MSKSEIKQALKEMIMDESLKIEVHHSEYSGTTVRIYIDNEQIYYKRT